MDHHAWKQRLQRLLSSIRIPGSRACSWDRPLGSSGAIERRFAGTRRIIEVAGDGTLLPIHEDDHVRGFESASITLVEYGDYQCPQCGQVYLEIEELKRMLGDRMRIVFRQYPYAKLHPQAELAAEAAEAAGAQGKFWEMHDMLFQNQDALTENHLVRYAETLNLDLGRFCWELKNRVYRDRVREDFRSGVMNGVYSTPSIFINDVRHNGMFDLETLCDAVAKHIPLPQS